MLQAECLSARAAGQAGPWRLVSIAFGAREHERRHCGTGRDPEGRTCGQGGALKGLGMWPLQLKGSMGGPNGYFSLTSANSRSLTTTRALSVSSIFSSTSSRSSIG
jgi:hypothetical protein